MKQFSSKMSTLTTFVHFLFHLINSKSIQCIMCLREGGLAICNDRLCWNLSKIVSVVLTNDCDSVLHYSGDKPFIRYNDIGDTCHLDCEDHICSKLYFFLSVLYLQSSFVISNTFKSKFRITHNRPW